MKLVTRAPRLWREGAVKMTPWEKCAHQPPEGRFFLPAAQPRSRLAHRPQAVLLLRPERGGPSAQLLQATLISGSTTLRGSDFSPLKRRTAVPHLHPAAAVLTMPDNWLRPHCAIELAKPVCQHLPLSVQPSEHEPSLGARRPRADARSSHYQNKKQYRAWQPH